VIKARGGAIYGLVRGWRKKCTQDYWYTSASAKGPHYNLLRKKVLALHRGIVIRRFDNTHKIRQAGAALAERADSRGLKARDVAEYGSCGSFLPSNPCETICIEGFLSLKPMFNNKLIPYERWLFYRVDDDSAFGAISVARMWSDQIILVSRYLINHMGLKKNISPGTRRINSSVRDTLSSMEYMRLHPLPQADWSFCHHHLVIIRGGVYVVFRPCVEEWLNRKRDVYCYISLSVRDIRAEMANFMLAISIEVLNRFSGDGGKRRRYRRFRLYCRPFYKADRRLHAQHPGNGLSVILFAVRFVLNWLSLSCKDAAQVS